MQGLLLSSKRFRSFIVGGSFFVILCFAVFHLYDNFSNSLKGALTHYAQPVTKVLATKTAEIASANAEALTSTCKQISKDPMIKSLKVENMTGGEMVFNGDASDVYYFESTVKVSGRRVGTAYIGFDKAQLSKRYASPSNAFFWAFMALFSFCLGAFLIYYSLSSSNHKFDSVLGNLKKFLKTSRKHSSQLRSFAKDILDGASEQSTSSQEIVSTMSEMRAMIRQTSEKIDEGKETANEIRQSSEVGKGIMHEMHNGMEEINRAAIQLDEINEVISEIKGQTEIINELVSKPQLLSFNASIEAARAGQYGKGFAVVAQEVSKLAEMSGMASKDISGLLGKSSEKVTAIVKEVEQRVKEGTEISTRSMSMFEEISDNISRLVENVENFTEANKEQEKGIAEVSVALDTLKEAIDKQQSRTNEVEQISKMSDAQSSAIYKLISNYNTSSVKKVDKSKSAGKSSVASAGGESASLPDNVASINTAKDKLISKNKGLEGAEITGDEDSQDIYKDFK